ncbi:MAG TPA: hypothetical protein VFB60_25080 [Ktedonobacteraceae bacterium]|nr:hypothetical protein [Ktedonobacteraceae bacterium]
MTFQWAQLSLRVKQAMVVVLLVAALCLAWGIAQVSVAQTHMHHTAIPSHTQIVDNGAGQVTDGGGVGVAFK